MPEPASNIDLSLLSRRYRGALVAYFARQLRDAALAEDLSQEVFVRLAALSTREDVQNVEGYIFRVAKNLVRDTKRRRAVRIQYHGMVAEDEPFGIDVQDAERIVVAREALSRVAKILDNLPERSRSIFVLHRMEAMSRKEIAEAYGISISAVEKHLGKVMAILMAADEEAGR